MGHIFQVECWANTLVGITCGLFMAMEIGKGIGEGKRKYFAFMYENKGKWEKRKVKRNIFSCKGN